MDDIEKNEREREREGKQTINDYKQFCSIVILFIISLNVS